MEKNKNQTYGLSKYGFKRKRLPEIQSNMFDRFEDKSGLKVNRDSDSIIGNIFNIVAYEIADLWTTQEDTYNAMYPNTAEGTSLTNSAMLAGIIPIEAEYTTVYISCYGSNNTVIPKGSIVASQTDSNITYSSIEKSVISLDLVNNIEVDIPSEPIINSIYTLLINGNTYTYTSKNGDSKNIVLSNIQAQLKGAGVITDLFNDVLIVSTLDKISTMKVGTSNLNIKRFSTPILFKCNSIGAVNPIIKDLTMINSSINGWDSCTNEVNASVGRNAESDIELRTRWNASLYANASTMTDAIQAKILAVDGVTECVVYENDTEITDRDGRPPHTIEAIVAGGNEKDIAMAIYQNKAGGIGQFGSISVSVNDTEDNPHIIKFNRPETVKIWLKIKLYAYDEEQWSYGNLNAVKTAILALQDDYTMGEDVILQRFIGEIYKNTNGVGNIEITACSGERESVYTANNIGVSVRQVAEFDESRIEVIRVG